MPATAMAAEPSPWTALAANRHVNEPDIENTEGNIYGDKYGEGELYAKAKILKDERRRNPVPQTQGAE